MAQEIKLMGAVYSGVPSVSLPDSNGTFHSFVDPTPTTATAADVATGKQFFDASGILTTGTNSGGGGASNLVHGVFTANSSTGVQTITLNYSGSGYPVTAYVFVKGGAYVNGSTWYSAIQRYAVGVWCFSKSNFSTRPTWTTSGVGNQGVTAAIYKSSAQSATSYTRTSAMNTNVYTTTDPSNTRVNVVKFRNSTTMKVYVSTSSYGLLAGIDYEYYIVYSA